MLYVIALQVARAMPTKARRDFVCARARSEFEKHAQVTDVDRLSDLYRFGYVMVDEIAEHVRAVEGCGIPRPAPHKACTLHHRPKISSLCMMQV